MAKQSVQGNDTIVLGASFTTGIGGKVIDSSNIKSVNMPNVSAAAIVNNQSLAGVALIKMLIIDKPTVFKNVDNTTNKTLASSIIMVSLLRNDTTQAPIDISLYFQVLPGYKPQTNAEYFCSFYDTTNRKWNDSGCTNPTHNTLLDRYECSCNHTTTFALVWSPKVCQCNSSQVLLPDCTCVSKPDGQVCLKEVIICFIYFLVLDMGNRYIE